MGRSKEESEGEGMGWEKRKKESVVDQDSAEQVHDQLRDGEGESYGE